MLSLPAGACELRTNAGCTQPHRSIISQHRRTTSPLPHINEGFHHVSQKLKKKKKRIRTTISVVSQQCHTISHQTCWYVVIQTQPPPCEQLQQRIPVRLTSRCAHKQERGACPKPRLQRDSTSRGPLCVFSLRPQPANV